MITCMQDEQQLTESKASTVAANAPEHATNTVGLSKAQKRRYYDKFGANEEKPRGWDWVDIISHLNKKWANIR